MYFAQIPRVRFGNASADLQPDQVLRLRNKRLVCYRSYQQTRYILRAQGGDYGAFTATRLGIAHPGPLAGIHLNFLVARRDLPVPAEPSPEERVYFDDLAKWFKMEVGYQQIQGTKPQTLAYGLTDSPAGLAAWLVEKFRTWSDCDGDVERVHSRDSLLANIYLYRFTGAIGSSF